MSRQVVLYLYLSVDSAAPVFPWERFNNLAPDLRLATVTSRTSVESKTFIPGSNMADVQLEGKLQLFDFPLLRVCCLRHVM